MSSPSTIPPRLSSEDVSELVEKTPPSGKKRSVGFVAFAATLGSFLFGYDTGVISGALPYMQMPTDGGGLALTPVEEGLVGFFLLIGCAFGALFGGRLSDKYGRRHNILLLAAIFLIGAIACAASPNLLILYPSRFLLGCAVGGASATVPVYLSETAPKRIRGVLVGIDQLMIVTGQLFAFIVNAVIANITGGPDVILQQVAAGTTARINGVETTLQAGEMYSYDVMRHIDPALFTIDHGNGDTWRYMLLVCTIPAIALWICMRMMPESSRWHAANFQFAEAIGCLKRVRTEKDDIPGEVQEMVDARQSQDSEVKLGLKQILKIKWLRRLLIIGALIGIFNQTTGVNTMMYYAPKVLQQAGFGTQAAITLTVLTGVASVIGSATGLYLLARFSRRTVLIFGTSGLTAMLVALALIFQFGITPHMDADGNVLDSMPDFVPYLVVVAIVLFMMFMQSGNAPATWVIMAELFPGSIRGVAMGLAVSCIWISNAIITFGFPPIMDAVGPTWTYAMFAIINVIAVTWMIKVVPETKYSSLEELEVEFEERYS
ncbi:MAG: MFS transporter [Ancrocorticia sp.]|uniref:MFS transporter n=1 Tax=Ancrocorticia sp. TaxID=2593684 RepID=UPI003F93BA43